MDKQCIGNKIATLRKEIRYTQKQLAEKLHVTDKAVSNWERGNNLPDLVILEPLAKELNISIVELLGLENESKEEVVKQVVKIQVNQKESMTQLIMKLVVVVFTIFSSFFILNQINEGFKKIPALINVSQLDDLKREIYFAIMHQSHNEMYFILLVIIILTYFYYFKKIRGYIIIPISSLALLIFIKKIGEMIWLADRATVYFRGTAVVEYWENFNSQYNMIVFIVFILILFQIGLAIYRKLFHLKTSIIFKKSP